MSVTLTTCIFFPNVWDQVVNLIFFLNRGLQTCSFPENATTVCISTCILTSTYCKLFAILYGFDKNA